VHSINTFNGELRARCELATSHRFEKRLTRQAQISGSAHRYEDAEAYANWRQAPADRSRVGVRCTWRVAGKPFVWATPSTLGKWMANTHQGQFPDAIPATMVHRDSRRSRSTRRMDMLVRHGRQCVAVTSDWYRPGLLPAARCGWWSCAHRKARTPRMTHRSPGIGRRCTEAARFLCTDQYCSRYAIGTRGKGEVSTGTNTLASAASCRRLGSGPVRMTPLSRHHRIDHAPSTAPASGANQNSHS